MPLYRRREANVQMMDFKCVEFVEELMYGQWRKNPLPREVRKDGGRPTAHLGARQRWPWRPRGWRRFRAGAGRGAKRPRAAIPACPTASPICRAPTTRLADAARAPPASRSAMTASRGGSRIRVAQPRSSGRGAKRRRPRGAPPIGGDGSSGAAGNVGGYNNFWIEGRRRFIINGEQRTSIIVDPANGRVPR